MKPIAIIMLISGLALGGLGTFAAIQTMGPDNSAELDRLRLDLAKTQEDLDRFRKLLALEKKKNNELVVAEVDATRLAAETIEEKPKSTEPDNPLAGIAEMLSDEDKAREGFAKLMEGVGKSMRTRMISGRVDQLSEALGLNDSQKEKISTMMDERGAAFQDLMMKRMRKQATDEDFAKFAEFGSFGEQMRGELDEDQLAVYTQMQEEERAQAVAQATRREMRTISRIADLSDDQAQEVEAILQEQVNQETPADTGDNFERMVTTREEDVAEMQQARLDALEPVLTTEQLGAYGTSLERQRNDFSRFTGGGRGGFGRGGGGGR